MMRNQAILVAGLAGRIILFVTFTSVVGRMLPPAEFGFVALVTAAFAVATEVIDLGTAAVGTRRIAAEPALERPTLEALLAVRRLVSLALFAAALVYALSADVEPGQRTALLAAACGIVALHLGAYQVAFQVRQSYRAAVVAGLAIQAAFAAAVLAALGLGAGGTSIALLVVVLQVSQALAIAAIGRRTLGYALRAPWLPPQAGDLLRAGWIIGVAGMAYKLSWHAASFLLWELASPAALASFNAAQRLVAPLAEMAWMFVTPLIAAMTVSVARDGELRVPLGGYAKLVASVAAVIAVAGAFTAPLVLRLLYGEHYATGEWSAVTVLRWLCLATFFALVTPVLVVGELARGTGRPLLLMSGTGLAASVAVAAWTIPSSGAQGGAMAVCVAEALMFAMLAVRAVARADLAAEGDWAAHLAPALLLAGLLWALSGWPLLQFGLACAWLPATAWLVTRLPAQRACRAALSGAGPQSASAGRGDAGPGEGSGDASTAEASRSRSSRLRTFQ